ncbi:MAG: lysophospholipid acyltransferase family protein [Desulfobacterales bacterium]|nr:lysophospholipid acyltransferase family protein [Desulfobacterales bacterium]
MHYTIFDTPIIKVIIRWGAMLYLKLIGWKVHGTLPSLPKFVLIAAPHTSNWDLPIMLCIAFACKAKIYWMGKKTIFRKPFEGLFKWLGGIPIDRSKSNNIVTQMIQQFENNEKLIMTIPPTGTRKEVMKWKTGFYYIAQGANVPIVLGFLDYSKKIGGIGSVFFPTGDIETDMKHIRLFYSDIQGKYPITESCVENYHCLGESFLVQPHVLLKP